MICWCFQEVITKIVLSEIVTYTKFFLRLSLNMQNKIKTKNYLSWFRVSTIRKIWSCHVVPQRTAMNSNETGTVEYSTELTFNSNLPNFLRDTGNEQENEKSDKNEKPSASDQQFFPLMQANPLIPAFSPVTNEMQLSPQSQLLKREKHRNPASSTPQEVKMTLPIPKPPVFSGNIMEYPKWSSAFDTLIEKDTVKPSHKLYYLGEYTTGRAQTMFEFESGHCTRYTPVVFPKGQCYDVVHYGFLTELPFPSCYCFL